MSIDLINIRGRVKRNVEDKEAQILLKQGWVVAPVDQQGDYNPIYDKGDLPSREKPQLPIPPQKVNISQLGDILPVEVI